MGRIILLPQTTIPAASTVVTTKQAIQPRQSLVVQSKFVRAAGGTSTTVYVQTSFDNGATWVDIMCHAFLITTATKISAISLGIAPAAQAFAPLDGALTADTIIQGVLGDLVRLKYVVAGTYTGASHLTVTGRWA